MRIINNILGRFDHTIYHDPGKAIMTTGVIVQFFGVTGAFTGYLYMYKGVTVAILPVAFAYLMFICGVLSTLAFGGDARAALKTIFWMFIVVDVVCLGVLVGIAGVNSVFSSLFLLIPSVTSCYCRHNSNHFWAITGGCVVSYFVLYLLVGNQMKPERGDIFLAISSLLCIITAGLCYYLTGHVRTVICDGNKCKSVECGRVKCQEYYYG